MNNYKIDEGVTAKVLDSCIQDEKVEKILKIIQKIKKVITDYQMEKLLIDNEWLNMVERCIEGRLNKVKVCQPSAYDFDELSEVCRLDKEFTSEIQQLKFLLSSYEKQRSRALRDFNISHVIFLNNRISEVLILLEKAEGKIKEFNNDLALKEEEYIKNYNDCLREVKKNKNLILHDELLSRYDEKVIIGVKIKYLSTALMRILDSKCLDFDCLLGCENIDHSLAVLLKLALNEGDDYVEGII